MITSTGKKKVLLRGPGITQSGYGVHTRQIARWLLKLDHTRYDVHFELTRWGDTPWLVKPSACDGLVGKMMERSVSPLNGYDVTVQVQLPNEWNPNLGRTNVGVTAGVETDRCNPAWIDACMRMDRIVVPSRHVRDTLVRTGRQLEKKISLVPESYSDAITGRRPNSVDELRFSTSFNFLVFGQLTGNNPENDRKNTFYAVKWLTESFFDDQDVGIVLKTNAGRNTSIDRSGVVSGFTRLMDEVRGKRSAPKLHLIHGDMTDDEVASLYVHPQVKCLVAATRGEGYGLPILEAATSGLPVVATNWSGHLDFLPSDKFVPLECVMKDIHPSRVDNNIFVKGSRWAEVKEDDFKSKIRKFRREYDTMRPTLDASSSLKETHSQAAIEAIWSKTLGDVL